MILALKTNDQLSELYLIDEAKSGKTVLPEKEKKWEAGRELSRTLLGEIELLLRRHSGLDPESSHNNVGEADIPNDWILNQVQDDSRAFDQLTGLIVFTGPGSFTGLRIGIATANALAYGLNIPITGTNGDDWLEKGVERLQNHENDKIVIPEYGAPANISTPKK